MIQNGSVLKDKHLTKITEIDAQHQQISDLLEAFCRLVADSHAENRIDERVPQCLAEIIVLTHKHFNMEQELMYRYNYAKVAEHCKEHATLLKEITFVKECCETDNMVMSYRSAKRLIDEWFLKHIVEMDKDLGIYLHAVR